MSTPQVARVAIVNNTGARMEQVVLTHRFGDSDAVDILMWDQLDPGCSEQHEERALRDGIRRHDQLRLVAFDLEDTQCCA